MSSNDFYNITVLQTYIDTLYMYPSISNQVSHIDFAINNLLEIIENNPKSISISNTIETFYGLIKLLGEKIKQD